MNIFDNMNIDYFVFLRDLSSALSRRLEWAFSELLAFVRKFWAFSVDTLYNALTFQLPSEDQILEWNILWLSSVDLTDIPYNADSHKIL